MRYVLNEVTIVPVRSCQPSTRTKSMILNGIEIIDGGSIIIPIAIRVEEITISMTRKGMKSKNPIWKARVSSLMIKAGITVSSPSWEAVVFICSTKRAMASEVLMLWSSAMKETVYQMS